MCWIFYPKNWLLPNFGLSKVVSNTFTLPTKAPLYKAKCFAITFISKAKWQRNETLMLECHIKALQLLTDIFKNNSRHLHEWNRSNWFQGWKSKHPPIQWSHAILLSNLKHIKKQPNLIKYYLIVYNPK